MLCKQCVMLAFCDLCFVHKFCSFVCSINWAQSKLRSKGRGKKAVLHHVIQQSQQDPSALLLTNYKLQQFTMVNLMASEKLYRTLHKPLQVDLLIDNLLGVIRIYQLVLMKTSEER